MISRPGRTLSLCSLALAFAAAALAAPGVARPVSARAARVAVSANVRDLSAAGADADAKLPAEWVRDNDRLPRSKGPFRPGSAADAALQSAAPSANMPGPSGTFAGISADDVAGVAGGRFAPPDTVGDVGPNHYVQAVNTAMRVFDKNGAPLTPPVSLGSFFGPLGSGCNNQFGDPIVLYDSLADRWLISQFGLPAYPNPPFHQCIAISRTADPTGGYYLFDFLMPPKLNDYPHFGVWPDGYYMSDNQFQNGNWAGAGLVAFDRAKMLAGDPTASYIYFDYFPIDPNAGGMLPSDLDGLTPPPPGTPNLFIEWRADEFPGEPMDGIIVYEFHADWANPGNSTIEVLPEIQVASFDGRTPGGRAAIEEPPPAAGGDYVDAVGDRMMNRLAYRTLADGSQSFVMNWTVNVSGVAPAGPSTYQAGVRFMEIRRDPGSGNVTIQNQVTYAPGSGDGANGRNIWMGSAAQDNQGNSAVGFSASSTSLFPTLLWAGRLAGDPANALSQGEATAYSGVGVQLGSGNRWGDYSALTVDPSDDCTFFYTQEFYANNNTFDWVTRVAKFAYPGCTPAPKGTVSGTVTVCNGGAPLQAAVVSDGLGHVRITGADGTYTMDLPPGPYTLTISKPNYTVGGGAVVVSDGQTTTLDACLTGVPALAASSATLTAESCLPPNGVPDPGETVTVTFCVQNTGGGDTTDLVATLQASGGVVNPPGPVDFGVVPAGGASVCRDFTFTVDPALACGADVTTTLALTDGASELGTLQSSFQSGVPVGIYAEGFDGVTAPALPSGWTASNAVGGSPFWVTTTSVPDTAPNAAFVGDPTTISDKRIQSPAIAIATAAARLTFRSNYNFENGYDGGVLEIAIGGGAFQDILAAGGSFVSGAYTATLNASANPLTGRAAWTGNSGGYVTTVVDLPASAAGSTIALRWRLGSDNGIGGAGWRVDTISISDGYACCEGIRAAGLTVDDHASGGPSNLNGVWEPGETVAIEPSYANNSPSAVALSGAASNLTGPAGAAYAIADGAASYGTIGSGTTGSCVTAGDCYAMTVDNPAARPAAHWDATFDELLSTGQSRSWTLHIGASFSDVPTSNPFYAFVENIFHNGVTGGCGAGTYCPGNDVTRAQMAVFILKAEHGSGFTPPACAGVFADVACPSQFANWIERFAAEGITAGCGGGNYCPNDAVTRAQMAVFLLKGEHGSSYVPPGCTGVFGDVPCPGGFAVDWIERLAAEGITAGCGGGNYCPSTPNTRGQMAVFLAKTFGLLLYGP